MSQYTLSASSTLANKPRFKQTKELEGCMQLQLLATLSSKTIITSTKTKTKTKMTKEVRAATADGTEGAKSKSFLGQK